MKYFNLALLAALILVLLLLSMDKGSTLTVSIEDKATYNFFIEEVAPKFEEDYGYDIEVINTTYASELEKIETGDATQADMFITSNTNIGYLAERNFIIPLENGLAGYNTAAYDTTVYNDLVYMMPISFNVPVFVYNTEKMISPLETMSEMPIEEWGCNFLEISSINSFIVENNGYLFNKNTAGNIEMGLENSNTITFIETVQSMYMSGVSPWKDMTDSKTADDNLMDAFINEEISAMVINSEDLYKLDEAGFKYKLAAIPPWDGTGTNKTSLSTEGFVINSNCDNMDAAYVFLEFVTTPELNNAYSDALNIPSPKADVEYTIDSEPYVISYISEFANTIPNSQGYNYVEVYFTDAMEKIANGADVATTLLETRDLINEQTWLQE